MAIVDYSFHRLPANAFPLFIELLDARTRTVRWSVIVLKPCVLRIPSKDKINNGEMVTPRVTYGDGRVFDENGWRS
jgi:hypothetical protein